MPEPKIIANDWVQLLELLNKVWDLGLLEIQLVRTNHKSESGFGGSTVLVGWCGQEVSFNTTGGV